MCTGYVDYNMIFLLSFTVRSLKQYYITELDKCLFNFISNSSEKKACKEETFWNFFGQIS